MKASALIKRIQDVIDTKGDKNIVIAANKHSYLDTKVVASEDRITLALFDKIPD